MKKFYLLRRLKKAMAMAMKPIPVTVGGIIFFEVPR
jgi:hypothetical protein